MTQDVPNGFIPKKSAIAYIFNILPIFHSFLHHFRPQIKRNKKILSQVCGFSTKPHLALKQIPYPNQTRAFLNMRIHGESSPQPSGCHECSTVRNTRSAWGIITVKRPSSLVTAVMPCGEPLGLKG